MSMEREPIGKAAIWVGLIMAFLTMLGTFGIIQWTDVQYESVNAFLVLAIPVLGSLGGALLTWYYGRKGTTPLSDPRDEDGATLVRTDVQ